MSSALLSVDDPCWGAFLMRTPHDVYHLPSYCKLSARQDSGTPAALHAKVGDTECLIPLVLRNVPAGFAGGAAIRDGLSPYGYASPLFTPDSSNQDQRICLDRCLAAAAELGFVTLFLRLHPLLTEGRDAVAAVGELVLHGQTVYTDLTRSSEALERAMASGHRYEIRRLRKNGFEVDFDDWTRLLDFADLYRETMRRVGASESYFFTDSYFSELRTALGHSLHIALAYDPAGTLAAASLFTNLGGIMQYHLSATAEPFLRLAPTKLILHEIAEWGRAAGARVLHLGGGVAARNDSLFRFKAGFSELRADFYTSRIITDPARYAQLLDTWVRAAEGAEPDRNYFPVYRQGLPSGS